MRLPADATLIALDAQEAEADAPTAQPGNSEAEANVAALIEAWRLEELPLIHVRRGSHPSGPCGAPGEIAIGWTGAHAFENAELERLLDDFGATTLVVCGASTAGSIAATARHAAELGFHVFLVADACWSADDEKISPSPSRLDLECAKIVDAAQALSAAPTAKARQRRDAARRR